ncbi:hypothetical protein [Breoghania sp. JC706]|uniref:hypothetical protein n=1 Tax=Breoghania sp. JC706 TaxID=3117732 RepID=UPI003009B30C
MSQAQTAAQILIDVRELLVRLTQDRDSRLSRLKEAAVVLRKISANCEIKNLKEKISDLIVRIDDLPEFGQVDFDLDKVGGPSDEDMIIDALVSVALDAHLIMISRP